MLCNEAKTVLIVLTVEQRASRSFIRFPAFLRPYFTHYINCLLLYIPYYLSLYIFI